MTIDYGAAFDVQSHAHQHVNLVLKAMDYLAKRKPDEQDCD